MKKQRNKQGDSEPIATEWKFSSLRARHYEPAGHPIAKNNEPVEGFKYHNLERTRSMGKNAGRCLGLVRGEKDRIGKFW